MAEQPSAPTRRRGLVAAVVALAIGSLGLVAGTAGPVAADPPPTSAGNVLHGFRLDRDGRFTVIDHPDAATTIGPNLPVTGTNLSGINNRGDLVGLFEDRSRVVRNFRRDPRGRYTIIDPPGSFPDEEAVDVNNRGEIVGFVDDNGENSAGTRGFLRTRQGRYVTIQVPGAVSTAALKVNDHGQVAGFYVDRANAVHGFLWDDREVTTIDHPGAEATFPFGINNRGDAVGVYYLADGSFHGFLRTPQGRFTTIDAPGAELGTQVASINDRGEMVGVAVHADSSTDGFFRGRWGRFTTIQAPGAATYTRALDINDGGDIVGDYDTRPANAGSTSAPRTRAADHSPAVRPVTAPGPRTR